MDENWSNYIPTIISNKLQYPNKISKSDWKYISLNPFLQMSHVHANPALNWDWASLSRQDFNKIYPLVIRFPKKEWDWSYMTFHFPTSFIEQHPNLPWLFDNRRYSIDEKQYTSMTMDYLLDYPHLKTPDRMCSVRFMSYHLYHPNITVKDYNYLSKNPYNQLKILLQFKNKPWNWKELSRNNAFPPQKIMEYRKEFQMWRWDQSLLHPRLTWSCYKELRRQVRIPYHFRYFIRNHFHLTPSLALYFKIVIERFLRRCVLRRIILQKVHLLCLLIKKVSKDTMYIITSFV